MLGRSRGELIPALTKAAMTTHTFTLVLSGPDPTEPDVLTALEEAGCNDALLGMRGGIPFADFDREAPSLGDAVLSAIRDLESAAPSLIAIRVEPEEFVTASSIAARTGRTRESVRLLIEGKRGPGGFPLPVAKIDGRTRLWRWAEVSQWLATTLHVSSPSESATLAAINAWLEVRRYGGQLSTSQVRHDFADLLREQLDRLSA